MVTIHLAAEDVKLLADVNNVGHGIDELYADNTYWYYAFDDGNHGRELWVSDGSGATQLLLDINSGSGGSDPRSFFHSWFD